MNKRVVTAVIGILVLIISFIAGVIYLKWEIPGITDITLPVYAQNVSSPYELRAGYTVMIMNSEPQTVVTTADKSSSPTVSLLLDTFYTVSVTWGSGNYSGSFTTPANRLDFGLSAYFVAMIDGTCCLHFYLSFQSPYPLHPQ